MQNYISWVIERLRQEGREEQEIHTIETELNDLKQRINTMPTISQSQIDRLTAEVAAATAATNDTAARVETIRTDLETVNAEVAALTRQLTDAGTPFDSSALDTALQSLTTEANSIAQATASAPAPVVPVTDPANPAGPVVTPPVAPATP